MDDLVLRVRKDLCLGCGLCIETCPRQAISLQSGLAQIDHNKGSIDEAKQDER